MNPAQYDVLKELIEEALETLTTIQLIVEEMRPKPKGQPALQALGLEEEDA